MLENYHNYNAEREIDSLLRSEKSSEEVEKEATEIISQKLYQYSLDEIKKNTLPLDDIEDLESAFFQVLSPEEMEKNFSDFIKKIKADTKLDFIKEIKKNFPEGKFYLVGGAVRDAFLGKSIKDYDIVVSGIPDEKLENTLKQRGRVDLVGKNFGVYKFRRENDKEYMDLVLPRQEKSGGSGSRRDFKVEKNWQLPIESDLARRDFTINAMAINLEDYQIIDPFGGQKDLKKGLIRAVGNPEERFSEDLSRIIRAIRFAVITNFQIEDKTWKAMQSLNLLKKDDNGSQIVPWETISEELKKSFYANPVKTFDLLDKSGLMKKIFPEIENLRNLKQPPKYHEEGDVFVHTRLILKALPQNSPLSLIFAALLHDIGKAETYAENEKGEITFFGHNKKSAEMARKICSRLCLTNELTNKIITLIDKHMTVFQVENMTQSKIYKLFFDTMPKGETSHELLRLHKADLLASFAGSEKSESYRIAREKINKLIAKTGKKAIKPFINGDDLIELGFTRGPIFRQILGKIKDLQIEGTIKNKGEAISYLLANRNNITDK